MINLNYPKKAREKH